MSELATVLATLHRAAAAMAAEPRPPARIKLGAGGVTLEWDVLPAGAPGVEAGLGALPAGVGLNGTGGEGAVAAPARALPAGPVGPGATVAGEPVASVASVASVAVQHTLTAPTVGVFYRSSEPGAAPFVDTGDLVSPGQQVGIVEAMKLMIPVEAERGGRIVEVLCADATSVEFGAPLFALSAD